MSSDTPITPSKFAAALQELPASSLNLKVLELRNSIAQLDYSNEELEPFAKSNPPDPVCAEAIAENIVVIERMQERLQLVKAEVERRGLDWSHFQATSKGEDAELDAGAPGAVDTAEPGAPRESPWTDGTFETGVIRDGQVHLHRTRGPALSDEELSARIEGLLRQNHQGDSAAEEGVHL